VCVSIALLVRRQAVVGVVFNPILNELFTATQVSMQMCVPAVLHTEALISGCASWVSTCAPLINRNVRVVVRR
jgi:fructose-1,6-bisphosphatase/inositol monophosphatase family enzyme